MRGAKCAAALLLLCALCLSGCVSYGRATEKG